MPAPRFAFPLIALAASALLFERQDASGFDTSGYPQDMVSAARLTERRCSKCHSLGRVLDSPSDEDWARVVHEMARKEKSGISDPEVGTIAGFLSYNGKRRAGRGAATSRPGSPDGQGAASRPTLFGGAAAYPSPTSAVYASVPLPGSAKVPAKLELPGTAVVVNGVSGESVEGVTRVTAHVTANDRETDLVLARDAAGGFSSEALTLRSWAIGPHAFRLVLAIYQTDPAPDAADRVDLVLALLVVRDAQGRDSSASR